MSDPIVKVCSCGREYRLSEWKALHFCGTQRVDGLPLMELRDCGECQSSGAVYFDESGEFIPADEDGEPIFRVAGAA